MGESRTHYQISLTARQAVGLFAGLLAALGLAFFFGLMTGYSGRGGREAVEKAASLEKAPAEAAAPGADAPPPIETGIPLASGETSKAGAASQTPAPEPTSPATLSTFADSAEEEPTPVPGSRTSLAGAPAAAPAPSSKAAAPPARASAPPAAAGKIWVQAASLSSHDEASALGARLSKHGFHAVVSAGSGPKGKVYRVRVGPYRSEDEAAKAVSRLAKQEKIREPWIVPEGK